MDILNISKKPKDSAFFQQRLWAWQPILTVKNVYPCFYIIGFIFIPLGVFFLITSNSVHEYEVPYTDCTDKSGTKCSSKVLDPDFYNNFQTCVCTIDINVSSFMVGDVYLLYGLTNFYQNHRRYASSRDDRQLYGENIAVPSSDCAPYDYHGKGADRQIYAPCGAVAMSLFNDTFTLTRGDSSAQQTVPMTTKNIAWKSDRDKIFGRPSSWANTHKPVGWKKTALERSAQAYSGDEELIVWMRTAALPSFRKLAGILERRGEYADGLKAGVYKIIINYSYPVSQFGGTKRVILTTTTWLGGKNPTLGIGYIVVGSIHLILAVVFTALHLILRKRCLYD